ncbi:FecR family protein [Sphingomonas sp.]|uniref:FecR family protein n=1 Tax=Sphingomonas sp. TaxID=28214 RepID=UPI002C5DE0AD|nr:FecR domain-containing protein [Sphingomonas sp.]HWK36048.1 FecR domain-containing protein [Sphingomonas sp.]
MSILRHQADERAAAWDAQLRGAQVSVRNRRAFHAWLREDPAHQAAHDRLQAALTVLQANADLPELSALRDEARNSVQAHHRRWMALVAVGAVAACAALFLIVVPGTERRAEIAALFQRDTVYVASPDERTRVTLADGSVVTLDAGARLSARLGRTRRDVTLLAGRALFHVAKDRQRPFVVKAGDRTITALGTVFDVRLSSRELRVTLAEGAVAVRPVAPVAGAMPQIQIMKPRQQLVAYAGAAASELRTVDTDKTLSWAEGQIFFDNQRLASAVDQMNQYSAEKIIVAPDAADLRINGMFRTTNPAGFIEALEVALPVAVHDDGQGRTIVSRRAGSSED